MGIGRRHVWHGTVLLIVLVQLGFPVGFLVDAFLTNRTYDTLTTDRIAVAGRIQGCAFAGESRSDAPLAHVCRVDYDDHGSAFSVVMPFGERTTVYVDPQNTSIRMTEVPFDGGPEETTVDIVLATLLLGGAVIVSTVHLIHLRRRQRRRRQSRHSDGRR
jgi:hypothetical protein